MTVNKHTTVMQRNVESSNIDSYAYTASTNQLVVGFKQGTVYSYTDVPKNVFVEFDNADSKGSYHATNIRGEYEFTKIDVSEEDDE